MMDCMNMFSAMSGLVINLGKSQIFCSLNMSNAIKRIVRGVTKTRIIAHSGRYLGVLILQRKVSKHNFTYIRDNMRKKSDTWQVDSLSLAS